ncbi:MAG TPA: YCF48-related protein [Candidatus Limnocylindrales bacterium]|nr:YCF48-related protein [Candidatus Limnocylindrales bacterium]
MGSQEDNSLDGLLRRSLARGAAQDECPGADLLAAYSERALEADEAARFEQHFSRCAHCRELLAAVVRASSEAEALQEVAPVMAAAAAPAREAAPIAFAEARGGTKSASPGIARDRTAPRLLRWWWLAPAAATVVLAVFLYVRHQSTARPALNMSRELAMSRSESAFTDEKESTPPESRAPATPASAPAAADRELKKRDEKSSADETKSIQNLPLVARNYEQLRPPTPPASARAAAGSGTGAGAGSAASESIQKRAAPGQRSDASQGVAGGAGAVVGAAGAAVGGATAALPKPSEKAAPSAIPAPPAQTESVQVQQEAGDLDQLTRQSQQQELQQQRQLTPQDQGAAQGKLKRENRKAIVASAANMISTIIAIPTPDKQVVYRIVGAGFVERTTDGGATWQGQLVSQNADFTAGSAPTAKICWLVGRAGAIFRTSDGTNWKKIPPPASVDLAEVNATDASTATVTAAGGQKYSTENAGKIWVASR